MGRILNHLAISDIHGGAPRIDSERLYDNFETFIYPQLNDELDILTCSGDFFDTAINLNSRHAYVLLKIIKELQRFAIKHKFYIRMLRGTYSHDRDQLRIFNLVNKENIQLNGTDLIKVYEKLDYEYIEPLNLKIAYIPDDLPYDDDYEAFKNILNIHKIDKVNILLSHCYYDHNIPKEYEKYISKKMNTDIMQHVTNAVLNGHIHITSVYRHNITIGSFESSRHGEARKKGFYKLQYDVDVPGNKYTFIENTNTLVFETLTLEDIEYNHELAMDRFKQFISKLYTGGDKPLYLRIVTSDGILYEVISKYVKTIYKNVILNVSKPKNYKANDKHVTCTVSSLPIITPKNIEAYIHKFLISKFDIEMDINEINEIFHEIKK